MDNGTSNNNYHVRPADQASSQEEIDEVWPQPAPKWTPINEIPIRERSPPSDIANEAKEAGLVGTALIQDAASDEQILSSTKLLEGVNLIRLAGKMSGKEIVKAVNDRHKLAVLTDKGLSTRMTKALTKVAEQQGRSRAAVKAELEVIRNDNGMIDRRTKAMTVAALAGKKAAKAQRQGVSPSPEAQTKGDEEAESMEPESDENLKKLRDDAEALLLSLEPSQIKNEELFEICKVFCNYEIREIVPQLSTHRISERLHTAYQVIAKQRGTSTTKYDVKAELDGFRRDNGVFNRQNAYTKARRAASMAAKKNKAKDEDAMDIDTPDTFPRTQVDDSEDENSLSDDVHQSALGPEVDGSDDEDPLGDLEEVSRRAAEGDLSDGDIDDFSVETVKSAIKPFDGRPVGYMAHDSNLFVPGFRAYNPDGTQILR